MNKEISSNDEINSETTISLNLSGATVAVGDDDDNCDINSCKSEVDDDHNLQIQNSFLPPNTSVNIENSSDVIVGPVTQFHGPVTIYQNNRNNDPSKCLTNGSIDEKNIAKLISSETLSAKPVKVPFVRRKTTIILAIVIVIIVVVTIILSYVISEYIHNENNSNNSRHRLIYRNEWGGRPPLYERPGKLPIKYVIIAHTAGTFCESVSKCSEQMVLIQNLHVEQGSPDVGYNFLIGGDENIYVARDWDNHNFHMNLDTIGIAFMGDFMHDMLTPGMIETAQILLKMGVDKQKLTKDYIIVAHNQTYNTLSPGTNVYKQIKFWPHFSPDPLEDVDGPAK